MRARERMRLKSGATSEAPSVERHAQPRSPFRTGVDSWLTEIGAGRVARSVSLFHLLPSSSTPDIFVSRTHFAAPHHHLRRMDNGQNPAIVGVWMNYNEKSVLLLSIPNPWGVVIVAAAGLWLSWSVKYIRKLAGHTALWIQSRKRSPPGAADDDESPSESTSLLGHDSSSSADRTVRPLARAFKDNRGIRDLFVDSFLSKEFKSKSERLWLLLFTILVALLAFGIIVGGYFWAQIRVDGPARLASDKCGLWLFEGGKRSEAATRARMLDLEKEERAAQFAADCYGRSGSLATRCKILYQPTLPVEAIYTNDCPFPNQICRLNRTVTFATSTIDAGYLGINGLSTPRFRRSTTCTPLSMEYPYIQNKTENGTTTFTYHYGSKQVGDNVVDYTYSTVGDPWDRLAPIYDVFAYSSNADSSDHPVWTPHPDLTPPAYSTVTIIFVSSLRILYEEYSSDPIFPADDDFYLPGDPKAWFRNTDPRARPLACINTIEVCDPDGTTCWNVNEPSNNNSVPDDTPEFIVLYSALYKTDIYYSLAKRQGRSLLAQKKVSQYFSAALGDDPWVAEVESWVWTALARTSINAWSVASGEDSVHANKGGFIEVTKGYSNLCGRYKYNPQGYQSLRFVPLMLLAMSLPLIWLLSWDGESIARTASPIFDTVDRIILNKSTKLLHRSDSFPGSLIKKLLDRKPARSQGGDVGSAQLTSSTSSSPDNIPPSAQVSEPQQTTHPTAESSTTAAAREHQGLDSANTGATMTPASTAQDSGNLDENFITWEPLVFHLLIYLVWFLITHFLVLLFLMLALISMAISRRIHGPHNQSAVDRGAGVRRLSS
ncbi:hypothetical protein CC86DRAFT_385206 [Ophiobolus disseminans]|uniref:Uncharacterized protein n=1 Tax=Ophiobolus disseminans TaxID=1469910 RepID=A0A6A6ZQC5_9PLEO|nr:hypothetical protein CC86DRAFT_385206 [Ophiobolus disseminans]